MRLSLLVLASAVALTFTAPSQAQRRHHDPCHKGVAPWLCAKRLSKSWYGWTGSEWRAEDALVDNESGWNYCAHYPSTTDCSYDGPDACGIPQAYYCPLAWRGHLQLWKRQVFWMLRYIHDRWGTPSNAYYHETHEGY